MSVTGKPNKKEQVIITACASHCGGRCLIKVHVRDGVISRIETDDGQEPQLRACLRCRAYRQRVYDPDRLKFPMRRVGERGEGKFERISWDEALDTIVSELKRVRSTYGPAAVFFAGGAGDTMRLNRSGLIEDLLAMTGGHTTRWGFQSFEGGLFASLATYGTLSSRNDFNDLLNSRLIIMWGWNPAITMHETNTSWYLLQAKESGTKIISVDPRYTDSTAILASQWIPILPGTDIAMLIAMAYVMIRENLHDQAFLDTYTAGFEQFQDYVLGIKDGIPKTPAWAENITGVSASVIENLAREYATTKPAALVAGIGPGRAAYGEQYHRAAKTLMAMTGNIGVHGGWSGRSSVPATYFGGYDFKLGQLPKSEGNPVEFGIPPRKDGLPTFKGSDSKARIHYDELADAILKGKAGGYPADLKMLLVMHTNPVNQLSNTNKMVRALKKLEFIMVAEQVMTATAKFADILLPVSTFMERNDIGTGGVTPFYGYVNKVIEPLYESKSPLEICQGLATRLGISIYSEKTDDEWIREMVKGSYVPDYDTFKKKAIYRIKLPEPIIAFKEQIEDPRNNPFPTPSGKIEIYSQRLADMNNPEIPPIPKYIEPWEGRNDPLAAKYPLQLITTHFKRRAHTQFEGVPWLRELLPQAISINSIDAKARGISDGDEVRVFNDRGEVVVPAIVTERIMPGVVDLPQGAWYSPDERGVDRGGCANVLTKDARSPGGAFCYNTGLVQVQKV
jgi:anaerobic dimethyl sulfoxide reductase subunit A